MNGITNLCSRGIEVHRVTHFGNHVGGVGTNDADADNVIGYHISQHLDKTGCIAQNDRFSIGIKVEPANFHVAILRIIG